MCMISGEVSSVEHTNIFAAVLPNNKQLTVYSNAVTIVNKPVAMILPFYGNYIEMIATTPNDVNVFLELDRHFPRFRGNKSPYGGFFENDGQTLEVLRSGSYRYSIAHSLEDFNRLDANVFQIDSELTSLLTTYKNAQFSFLVCIIDSSASYSPIAYVTNHNGTNLFIPTKHYHQQKPKLGMINTLNTGRLLDVVTRARLSGGGLTAGRWTDGPLNDGPLNIGRVQPETQTLERAHDWDHQVYLVGVNQNYQLPDEHIKRRRSNGERDLNTVKNQWSWSSKLASKYDANTLIKYKIVGDYYNIDIMPTI